MIEQGVVMIDGQPFAPEAAQVNVFDRGFLYGDSVFEALRTYAGKPFALDEHMARLARSAELVNIAFPLAPTEFSSEIRHGIALGGFAETYVRVMLTRGRAEKLGLASVLAPKPLRVVMILPLEAAPAEKYELGIAAITYKTQRISDGTSAAGAKLGNYLISVLATDRARSAGAEEAILVDHGGSVLEGATSNIFLVKAAKLITPPLSQDILAGITRHHLLAVANELGLVTEERRVSTEELAHADELFLSSSIRELLPIVRVDGNAVALGRPGPVFARLLSAFRERARESAR